jgi:hypothetical protein
MSGIAILRAVVMMFLIWFILMAFYTVGEVLLTWLLLLISRFH